MLGGQPFNHEFGEIKIEAASQQSYHLGDLGCLRWTFHGVKFLEMSIVYLKILKSRARAGSTEVFNASGCPQGGRSPEV